MDNLFNPRCRARAQQGFTLIELMIVVVIIGVLAAIAIPKFGAATDLAKEKEALGILKQVYVYQTAYQFEYGGYATSHAELSKSGWGVPSTLKYYTMPADPSLPLCMTKIPGSGGHPSRSIATDGQFGAC